jgi:hypothetical protein
MDVRKDCKSVHVEAKISGVQCIYSETFTFDTEESTIGWFNDIQYAKFLNSCLASCNSRLVHH